MGSSKKWPRRLSQASTTVSPPVGPRAGRCLEHAIKIMGIDHVGIGTDFDGDGGVTGLADSSELINFTRQLLARRYSERDIQKIWGGNFLRVMSLVQKK